MNSTFYVSDYRKNAVDDDAAIAECMKSADAALERTVVFDGDDYLITRSVLLPSNTTVIIDNCTINLADYSISRQ